MKPAPPVDIEWHVYAMRDKETIHVLYLGNRFISVRILTEATSCTRHVVVEC